MSVPTSISSGSHDRQGLYATSVTCRPGKVNAIKANTMSRNNLATGCIFDRDLGSGATQRLLALIQQVPNVITARRRV